MMETISQMEDARVSLLPLHHDVQAFYNSQPCGGSMTCSQKCQRASNFKNTCDCIPLCMQFGTCCLDFEEFCMDPLSSHSFRSDTESNVGTEKELQHTKIAFPVDTDFYLNRSRVAVIDCASMPSGGFSHFYVVSKCPRPLKQNQNMTEVQLCEGSSHTSLKQYIPVHKNSLTYRNIFCARCNQEYAAVPTLIHVNCDHDFVLALNISIESLSETEILRALEQKSCNISYRDFSVVAVPCNSSIIRSCNASYETQVLNYAMINVMCEAYASYIKLDSGTENIIFANAHCALCNGATLDQLVCLDPRDQTEIYGHVGFGIEQAGESGISTFFILMDFSGRMENVIDSIRQCRQDTEVLNIGINVCTEVCSIPRDFQCRKYFESVHSLQHTK